MRPSSGCWRTTQSLIIHECLHYTKNSKILVAVVAVIVIVAAAAAFLALGGGSGKSTDTDYTLLDDDDNIKKGVIVESTGELAGGEVKSKYVVESVNNETFTVTYTVDSSQKNVPLDEEQANFDSYLPSGALIEFDYTDKDDIPETVTVDVSGDNYKITGSYECEYSEEYKLITTYDLTVTFDGLEVTAVNGTLGGKLVSDFGTIDSKLELETADGAIKGTNSMTQRGTIDCDISDFYYEAFLVYNELDYYDATITSEKGKYCDVDVMIYTINGPVDEYVYKNVKIYVYHDLYILHEEGKVAYEGTDYDATLTTKIKA